MDNIKQQHRMEEQVNQNLENTMLDKYIKDIVNNEGYITYDVEIKNVTTEAGCDLGVLFAIDLKGITEDGEKETNIFVKHIVKNIAPLIFDMEDIFKREEFIYKNLIKEFNDLQEEYCVPVGERFITPKAFDVTSDEAIILENLAIKGFKTYHKSDVIKFEYAELVVRDLARLHGISFAMELKKSEYFKKNIKNMKYVNFSEEKFHVMVQNKCVLASQYLEDGLWKKIERLLKDCLVKYPRYITDNTCIKTLCHGDFRHNNVMVKEIDDKPAEVITIDYQIAYFGNPVLDFIYFIFWGTDQEFRSKHLEYLKDLYHQHLGLFLKHFDINVEDVFPKKEFEKQYQEKLDYGLMISVFYLPFLFPPEDEVPDLTETTKPVLKHGIKVNKKYGERLRGNIEDFMQWGYLQNDHMRD